MRGIKLLSLLTVVFAIQMSFGSTEASAQVTDDCFPPFFYISEMDTSLFVVWQDAPTATYLLYYCQTGDTNTVCLTVTGTQYEFVGLPSNTSFSFWMAKICNGDTSDLSAVHNYTTPCGTFTAPYTETFTTDANCWSWENNSFTHQSGYIYTTSYGPYSPILAVSPVIDASGLAHPYLRFSHYQPDFQGYHKDVAVYYRDDEQDSWHKLGTYVKPTTDWVADSLSLPSNSPTLQIAFEGVGNAYNTRAQFDNISVYDGPACPVVSGVALAEEGSGDVLITWIGTENGQYMVRYRKDADTAWENAGIQNVEFIQLSGLDPLTDYVVEVAILCDSGMQYIAGTFTTGLSPAGLPYFTDFADTSDQAWILDNGSCINQWMMGAPGVGTLSNALFIAQHYTTTAGYNVQATTNVCAYKTFQTDAGPFVYLEFDVQAGGESYNDYLKVFWAPDSVEYPASTGNPTYSQLSHTTYALNFSDYLSQTGSTSFPYKLNLTNDNVIHVSMELDNITPNGVSKLVFAWHNNYGSGTQPGAIVSNVNIWQPSCYAVNDLFLANTFMDTAVVTWSTY